MATTQNNTLEVEFDNDKNRSHYFRPLKRSIRGRFDHKRVAEPLAMRHPFAQLPVPGQSIRLNLRDGTAELVDHLHDSDYREVRRKIKDNKQSIPEPVESLGNVSIDSFVHYLKLACDAKYAKLTAGEFPDYDMAKVEGVGDVPKSVNERLADGIEKLVELMSAQKR